MMPNSNKYLVIHGVLESVFYSECPLSEVLRQILIEGSGVLIEGSEVS